MSEHRIVGMRKSFREPEEGPVTGWCLVPWLIAYLVLLQICAIAGYWLVKGELWLIQR